MANEALFATAGLFGLFVAMLSGALWDTRWWRAPIRYFRSEAAATRCHVDTGSSLGQQALQLSTTERTWACHSRDAGLTRPSSPRNHSSASKHPLGSPKANPS